MKQNQEYNQYLQSAEWKERRENRLKMDNRVCCVCGRPAEQVHHLTYERIFHEEPKDLISLCAECHHLAEELANPGKDSRYPYGMRSKTANCFQAAVVEDAETLAPVLYEYTAKAAGKEMTDLLKLMRGDPERDREYYGKLRTVINALCAKRYWQECLEDRGELMLTAITDRFVSFALGRLEHECRNLIQQDLHDQAILLKDICRTGAAADRALGLSKGMTSRLIQKDGDGWGDSARSVCLCLLMRDAANGIRPESGFKSLTQEDYELLNTVADYIMEAGQIRKDE